MHPRTTLTLNTSMSPRATLILNAMRAATSTNGSGRQVYVHDYHSDEDLARALNVGDPGNFPVEAALLEALVRDRDAFVALLARRAEYEARLRT